MSKFRLDGLKATNAVLGNLPRGMGKAALVRVGKRRLEPMKDAAKANAPVAEGDLRDSIIVSTVQGSPNQRKRKFANKAAVEIYMGPSSQKGGLSGYPEAVPQEFGSINNPPSGYMRRAWDEHHQALLDGLAEDLGQEVDKTAKRYARKLARNAAKG
ncbi:MAG: phage protein gp10 family [Variovorax sp.]|nr:phage protein gp10 family [Variovorax sp.]